MGRFDPSITAMLAVGQWGPDRAPRSLNDQERHRTARTAQGLRRPGRPPAQRSAEIARPRHSRRLDLRASRSQWRGQIHHDQHHGGPDQQDRRDRPHLGLRPGPQPAPVARGDRRGSSGTQHRPVLHAARRARRPGRALRRAAPSAPHRRDPLPRRSDRPGRRLRPHALGRHETPPADRQGAGPRPARARARRAHRGRRHRTAPDALGLRARTQRRRHHHHPHHPLPRGGRADVRPYRHHQQRRADRLGTDRVSDRPHGRQDPRRHARAPAGGSAIAARRTSPARSAPTARSRSHGAKAASRPARSSPRSTTPASRSPTSRPRSRIWRTCSSA